MPIGIIRRITRQRRAVPPPACGPDTLTSPLLGADVPNGLADADSVPKDAVADLAVTP